MSNTYLPSKARYEILDGLRGVAAMIVLLYHHFDLYIMGTPADAYINHGYLAVDLFLDGWLIQKFPKKDAGPLCKMFCVTELLLNEKNSYKWKPCNCSKSS